MTIPNTCPACGVPHLCLSEAVKMDAILPSFSVSEREREQRATPTVICACMACEFIYELTQHEQALYHATMQQVQS